MDKKTDATDPNDNCSLVVANQTETPDATWTAADLIVTELVTETKLPELIL
jgi:hypothetical protein